MASDTGPSSPDDSFSSPIGNTLSSPDNIAAWGARGRRQRRGGSSTPSSLATTPQAHRSRFAATSETTPTPSRTHRQASGGANGRPFAASTPSSTDDAPPSSECGDGYNTAEQMYIWGTNISVQDVNAAIVRFLRNFMEGPTQADSIEEGKYMRELDRVFEIEREWIDIDAQDIYNYDQDLYNKMARYPP